MALRAEIVIDAPTRTAQARRVARMLRGLVALDGAILSEHASRGSPLPPLYACGIRWRRHGPTPGSDPEPGGSSPWWDCDQCLAAREADCKDLVAWRCAELERAGVVGAVPGVIWTGPNMMHAIVAIPRIELLRWRLAPGSDRSRIVGSEGSMMIEDPSRTLGMHWRDRGSL